MCSQVSFSMRAWVWLFWRSIWMEVFTRRAFQPGGSWGGRRSTCQLLSKIRHWKTQCRTATPPSAGWCPGWRWRDYWVTRTRAMWWIMWSSRLRSVISGWRAGTGTLRPKRCVVSLERRWRQMHVEEWWKFTNLRCSISFESALCICDMMLTEDTIVMH